MAASQSTRPHPCAPCHLLVRLPHKLLSSSKTFFKKESISARQCMYQSCVANTSEKPFHRILYDENEPRRRTPLFARTAVTTDGSGAGFRRDKKPTGEQDASSLHQHTCRLSEELWEPELRVPIRHRAWFPVSRLEHKFMASANVEISY
jgi:hypothetical protein